MSTHNFIVTGVWVYRFTPYRNTLILHEQNVLVIDDMSKGKYKIPHKNVTYLHQDVADVFLRSLMLYFIWRLHE